MITATPLRELELRGQTRPGRPAHLSAASGLVLAGAFIYVVADDEMHLGIFDTETGKPGRLLRLFEGTLPAQRGARKKRKPDFEALCRLPPDAVHPFGALLALGSGSTASRCRGAVIGLDGNGAVAGPPRTIDAAPVLHALQNVLAVVNIEGAVVVGRELVLFNRGNGKTPENAVVQFDLDDFLNPAGQKPAPRVRRVDLGGHEGVPFCFTDAVALPNGDIVFTTVAEDTGDAYEDGPCVAAAVGVLDPSFAVKRLEELDRPYKVEGIAVAGGNRTLDLLLVTDADDPRQPSLLLSASLHR